MSTKYKVSSELPSDVLCARLDELAVQVTKGRLDAAMRVPAEIDRDIDIILSEASNRIRKLEGRLE